MEKADVVIIGAGVVGLAIAWRLSLLKKEIVLLERHAGFGREASSRNSEVIHAGMYRNGVPGLRLMNKQALLNMEPRGLPGLINLIGLD